MDNTIKCLNCGVEIEISEALKHKIEEEIVKNVEKKLKKELEEKTSFDLKDLKRQLEEKEKKVNEFLEKELLLREEKRKLEEEKRELKLEVQRTLDEERKKIEEKILKEEEERQRLKFKEKEEEVDGLKRKIEELSRKATHGSSQQRQGEVLELDLEEQLTHAFPTDDINPVAKGQKGGDIVQIVKNSYGKIAGSILWETKRAKWSPSWLAKLREDTRKAGASASILVTEELPREIENFGFIEGILTTTYNFIIPIAVLVRRGIMQTAAAKASASNKDEKLEMLYQYLQSDSFRHRFEAYAEGIIEMKNDLDTEKRSMERLWKKREMQIKKSELAIANMYGELQGIMGSSLPDIKHFALEDGTEED